MPRGKKKGALMICKYNTIVCNEFKINLNVQ